MAEDAFKTLTENKVEKSLRNTEAFKNALKKASEGKFDVNVTDVCGQDLLKVTEIWSIRKMFSLEEGKDYYKLYKEVFYIQNPHKYYFDTVEPTVYRRISGQKEQGDKEWADAVAKHLGIQIIEK